jgi:hypothetical protein
LVSKLKEVKNKKLKELNSNKWMKLRRPCRIWKKKSIKM